MTMPKLLKTFLMFTLLASVAACGRAGPLEPPPATATAATVEDEEKNDTPEDKPFILDGLLN